MALASGHGAEVDTHPDYTAAQWWFGEDQGRYLVTVSDVEAFQAYLAEGKEECGVRRLGTVGGDSLFGAKLSALREAHESFFRNWMEVAPG